MPTLNWIGKDKVVTHHNDVPFRVLDRKYTFGDTPNSGNMIIHGDNLEALKALLPEYENRIKCIYIDPPYNTGNENWVYNDNVNDPHIRKWLGLVVGSEVDDLTRHDKWLCMMYPRLILLKKLLKEDGAIFISIDDNEVFNLKQMCDEVFGASNYLGCITVVGNPRGRDYGGIARMHDYILSYGKPETSLNLIQDKDGSFEMVDELGGFELRELRNRNVRFNKENRPNLYYPFYINTNSTDEYGLCNISLVQDDLYTYELFPAMSQGINTVWRWGKPKSLENLNINIKAKPMKSGGFMIVEKYRENRTMARSVWWDKDTNTEKGTLLLKNILGKKNFDYPKPVEMIERILEMGSNSDGFILDSFAGSGTTAHAVLNLNKQDGGNRKFILCEMCDYAESITAERVRKVITGYDYQGKDEDELYSKKLTPKSLLKGDALLKEAQNAIEENKDKYDSISKPAIKDNCIKVIGTKIYNDRMEGLGGSFDFYELGETIFDPVTGNLNDNADTEAIRRYVWFSETNSAYTKPVEDTHPYLLGSFQHNNYYFYYIKGEETCLDWDFLNTFTQKDKAEMYIIYADRCVLTEEEMLKLNIRFKKIPRDLKRV